MNVIAEDIRTPAKVNAVLPSQNEVFWAVWGSAVEASGGPAAKMIVERLNELAELYAAWMRADDRQSSDAEAHEFVCRRDNLIAQIEAQVAANLPGLSDRTRDDILTSLDALAALAVRTHRAYLTHKVADPIVNDLWTRLASRCDAYGLMAAALAGIPPWVAEIDDDLDDHEVDGESG